MRDGTQPAVDVTVVEQLLRRVESDVHRGGWDRPAVLFALVDAAREPDTAAQFRRLMQRAGLGIRVGDYLAQPVIRFRDGDPSELLWTMARTLAYIGDEHQLAVVRHVLRCPGVVGFAAVMEMWGNNDDEVLRRAEAGTVQLADQPGSYEARSLISVLVTGETVMLVRRRGEKPQPRERVSGNVETSLRVMVDVVNGVGPSAVAGG